jgi:hypothetical protein
MICLATGRDPPYDEGWGPQRLLLTALILRTCLCQMAGIPTTYRSRGIFRRRYDNDFTR